MVNPLLATSSGMRMGVAGAGAWGTALALAGQRAGQNVVLWSRHPGQAQQMARTRRNSRYLPEVEIADDVRITSNLADLAGVDVLLAACPAQALRGVLQTLPDTGPVLICAKGIERGSGLLMNEVFERVLPGRAFGILSGPGFAADVARGLPTAITVATGDLRMAARLAGIIGTSEFRPYASDDVTGVAVGGAVKNVLAIACGIVEGRGLGESARAALTARGFAEMARFGVALGGRHETVAGLSGLGDLILTASSRQSRNFSLGLMIAREGLAEEHGPLAEGAATAEALVTRARHARVDMPIAEAVADILAGRTAVDEAIAALLSRPFKSEA